MTSLKEGDSLYLIEDEEVLIGGDKTVIIKAGTQVTFVDYSDYDSAIGWIYHVYLPDSEYNPEFHFDIPDFAVSKKAASNEGA